MLKVRYAMAVVGALGLVAAASQGRAQTLQDLVNSSGSITEGNQVYSGFTSGGNLPASDVTVNFTATGIQFTANWNTLTPGNDSSVISYTVTPVPGSGLNFNGAQLFFAGQVVVNNATASVGETLTDTENNNKYSMSVFYAGKTATNNNLTDSVTINPTTNSLRIVKSIDVAATGANSFASLNFVENTYSQTPTNGSPPPVPEPMSLALLPLALAGLGLRKKLAR